MGAWAAFSASITWTIGTTIYSLLSKRYPPHAINTTRAVFGLVGFSMIASLQLGGVASVWHALQAVPAENAFWLCASVFGSFALGDVFFILALRSLGVPAALAISSSYPIWSALSAWVFRGEALSMMRVFGLLVTIGGVVTVILAGRRKPKQALSATRAEAFLDRRSVGVGCAFLTSIAWAFNTYAVSQGGLGQNPSIANIIRMAFTLVAAPAIGIALTRDRRCWIVRADLARYAWGFGIEVIGGGFFFVYGLTHTTLAVGASLSGLAPVISVPIALALGWETFNRWKLVGILATTLGVIVLVTQ